MADDPHATGLSLWLVPDGNVGTELARTIDRLALRFRTRPFPPHVTLLAGLRLPEPDVLEAAGRAARAMAPFTVRLSGVEGRDEHFRCLFVRAAADSALLGAHALVVRTAGVPAASEFLPHLSLVYGTLLPEQKQALAHELGGETSMRFTASRLHVWRTEGPVGDWRELGAFALQAS